MNVYPQHDTVSHTLAQFVTRATDLYSENGYNDEFIRFGLTGEYLDGRRPKQVFMDPLQNMVEDDTPITIRRDYDSLLGAAPDILVNSAISVFCVPHPSYALKDSIHVKRTVAYQRVKHHQVEYHKIPNFEFGKWDDRHHLNIFFPDLWTPERGVGRTAWLLTKEERAFWYDVCLRPAIKTLLGADVAREWPATFETECLRASRIRGYPQWATRLIPREYVRQLATQIRAEVEEALLLIEGHGYDWAKNFFILHTVRGTKHTTMHHVDEVSAEFYLSTLIEDAHLAPEIPAGGDWYVDVAIELSSPDAQCLQWVTASHNTLVQQALQIPDLHASRITRMGSSKYVRDPASHLTAVSGFRITPGLHAQGNFEASYIQAYTTDKTVVANKDAGHHAKHVTLAEAMGPTQPTKNIEALHAIYDAAIHANPSSARLEVRVPYQKAAEVLVEFDDSEIRRCLCSFTPQEWWCFRIIRLMAVSQTFGLQAEGHPPHRVQPEALTLTAGCVWLVNGQHAHPDDRSASRMLLNAILPVTEAVDVDDDTIAYNGARRPAAAEEEEEEEEEEGEEENRRPPDRVAYNPYGCVFFRHMMLGQTPRLRYGGPVLSGVAFRALFKMTPLEVDRKYNISGIVGRELIVRARSTTSKSKMVAYANFTGAPQPNLFNLTAGGHTLPPPSFDDGSDVEDRSSPAPEDQPADLDAFVSDVYRQFLVDIAVKSPNPKGISNPSYLKLDTQQRRAAREDIYSNLLLSDVWRCVAYRHGSSDDWSRAFKWLFPMRGVETREDNQYAKCPYYIKWLKFVNNNEVTSATVNTTRNEIWKRIRRWEWMPDAQQDKIWPTRFLPKFTRQPPAATRVGAKPAPRILLKTGAMPEFIVEDGSDA
ncbi:hypothetical protein FPV67DRAFT_1430835 [Lyophyllum atratum]|nr:hypothetical protein FPV67DRAFT_1430835 [Lyophyllum atratum]